MSSMAGQSRKVSNRSLGGCIMERSLKMLEQVQLLQYFSDTTFEFLTYFSDTIISK